MKPKQKPQKPLLHSQNSSPSSSDDEGLEDYEEDQNNMQGVEEEKVSVNGESDTETKPRKGKAKTLPPKNPTKKLRNQKKPRIVMNVSGFDQCFLKFVLKVLNQIPNTML